MCLLGGSVASVGVEKSMLIIRNAPRPPSSSIVETGACMCLPRYGASSIVVGHRWYVFGN
jgi:hypothetical protein